MTDITAHEVHRFQPEPAMNERDLLDKATQLEYAKQQILFWLGEAESAVDGTDVKADSQQWAKRIREALEGSRIDFTMQATVNVLRELAPEYR